MKIYLKTNKPLDDDPNIFLFGSYPNYIIIADENKAKAFFKKHDTAIVNYFCEYDSKNSLIPLFDYQKSNARIEPGAIIRERTSISDKAIILMGAVINVGAKIGDNTMIDMNATIGSNAIIGNNCHIGAGAVICGTLEPTSKKPVVIEDNVFIGANATILAGVKIATGSTIGAGAVVTHNVIENTTVVGVPARPLDYHKKIFLNNELRK